MAIFGIKTKKEKEAEALEEQTRRQEEAKIAEEKRAAEERVKKDTLDTWFEGYKFKDPEVAESCKDALYYVKTTAKTRILTNIEEIMRWHGTTPKNFGLYSGETLENLIPDNSTLMGVLATSSIDGRTKVEMLSTDFLNGPMRKAFNDLYQDVYYELISKYRLARVGREAGAGRTIGNEDILERLCTKDYEIGCNEIDRCLLLINGADWTIGDKVYPTNNNTEQRGV